MDASTMTAVNRALGVTELLERVLLYLPLKDLLFSVVVCKQWQSAVNGSPCIQRALFYKPVNDVELWFDERDSRWKNEEDGPDFAHPLLNPLLHRFFNKFDFYPPLWPVAHFGVVAPILPENDEDFPLCAMHYKKASWRSMVMTQPPCSSLAFLCVNRDGHDILVHVISGDSEPLTMDHVIKGLRDHWHYCPQCPTEGYTDGGFWEYRGQAALTVETLGGTSVKCAWDVLAEAEEIAAAFKGKAKAE